MLYRFKNYIYNNCTPCQNLFLFIQTHEHISKVYSKFQTVHFSSEPTNLLFIDPLHTTTFNAFSAFWLGKFRSYLFRDILAWKATQMFTATICQLVFHGDIKLKIAVIFPNTYRFRNCISRMFNIVNWKITNIVFQSTNQFY